MDLKDPVSSIPLVGPSYAKRLEKLGIKTVRDLIFHFPHRYQNFALFSEISAAQPGEVVTVQGQVTQIKNIYTRSRKIIQQGTISDGQDTIDVVWFNQTYLVKNLPIGTWVSLSGKVGTFGRKRSLVSPEYEKIQASGFQVPGGQGIHTGRLVPVYPETNGLSSKWLRGKIARVIKPALSQIDDYLPKSLRSKNNLVDLKSALQDVHFPETEDGAERARRRLAFDEFFKLQLAALWRKKDWKTAKPAPALKIDQEKVLGFINNLPFTLTQGQKQSMREILEDLKKPQSMNRLLEGDVGSGKTVVAALAAYLTWLNGYKTVFMAPTQILATQHHKTLQNMLATLGLEVELVTSETKKRKNEKTLASHLSGVNVIVGTHALLHRELPEGVALVVIDEQHRFGVAQRALLSSPTTHYKPHTLTMTATPIPRTVALTMYGDLDLSQIFELPKGRIKIKTWVVPPQKRKGAYDWIRERVKNTDEQAFIVCPLIDVSEAETLKNVKAASAEFERLKNEVFPDLRLALLHGRIRGKDKDKIMNSFRDGKIDILVATPVVEVGIDIPSATIMLIEASERFGLAGLHQLRGRVGRGNKQSYCLLFTENRSQKTQSRLKALERDLSGAQLAELDLKLRGPGEVYGTAQSGFPELKVGSYSDLELIKKARSAAEEFLKTKPPNKVEDLIDKEKEVSLN